MFKYSVNNKTFIYIGCKDVKIWMVVRHGTRLPSAKDIVGMNTTLNDLKYEVLLKNKQGKGMLYFNYI